MEKLSLVRHLETFFCVCKMSEGFLGFLKYSSMITMIMQLGVHSFDILVHNAKIGLSSRLHGCSNAVVDIVRFADTQNV